MRPNGRTILRDSEARHKIFDGLEECALTVLKTLGPSGREVAVIRQDGVVFPTKDGVTVAKEVHFNDLGMEYGANLIAQAAQSTAAEAGDGTTSTVCLAYNLIKAFNKTVPDDIRSYLRGADTAKARTIEVLKSLSSPVSPDSDELRTVALVSSNHDEELADLIAEAYKVTGKEGIISIQDGQEDGLEIQDGMKVQYGWKTSHFYFLTDPARARALYEDAYVLVFHSVKEVEDLVPVLEQALSQNKPLVIFCSEMSDEVKTLLMHNRKEAGLSILPVQVRSSGDRGPHLLQDIAARTGATYFPPDYTDLKKVTLDNLGAVERIECYYNETTFIAPTDTQAFADHVEVLKGLLENSLDVDKEYNKDRLARFLGKVAILRVAGNIQAESNSKKFLVEDAVLACRTALEQGVIIGGGVSYVQAAEKMDSSPLISDELRGFNDFCSSLSSIFLTMADNAKVDGEKLLKEPKKKGCYDFKAGNWGGRVLDPLGAQLSVIDNAFSVFESFVNTEALITENKDSEDGQGRKEA